MAGTGTHAVNAAPALLLARARAAGLACQPAPAGCAVTLPVVPAIEAVGIVVARLRAEAIGSGDVAAVRAGIDRRRTVFGRQVLAGPPRQAFARALAGHAQDTRVTAAIGIADEAGVGQAAADGTDIARRTGNPALAQRGGFGPVR